MTLARTLPIRLFFVAALFFLSGCATMNLDYEEPTIELISFKALPANGFEQNFEIGLKLTNPNNFELPFNFPEYFCQRSLPKMKFAGQPAGCLSGSKRIRLSGKISFGYPGCQTGRQGNC